MPNASIYDFDTIIAERERIKKEEEGARNGVDVSDKGPSNVHPKYDDYGQIIGVTNTDSLLHYPTPWTAPGSYYTDYVLDDEIILGTLTVTNIIESPIPNRILP